MYFRTFYLPIYLPNVKHFFCGLIKGPRQEAETYGRDTKGTMNTLDHSGCLRVPSGSSEVRLGSGKMKLGFPE